MITKHNPRFSLLILSIVSVVGFGVVKNNVFALASLNSDLDTSINLEEDTSSPNHSLNFTVTLSPNPTSEITTSFNTDGQCELSHNFAPYTSGGTAFTKNDKLIMRVRAVDDSIYEGDHSCNISLSSISDTSPLDPAYTSETSVNYTLKIKDNDVQIINSFNVLDLSHIDLKEGSETVASYQLSISHAPFYDVIVTATADNQCDLLDGIAPNQTVSKTISKTFSAQQKNSYTFNVVAVNDSNFEGVHKCQIHHISSTKDEAFKNVTIAPYEVTVIDNEINPNKPDPREYEGGIIYFEDANADGIKDDKQPSVASFINKMNNKRQAILLVDKNNKLLPGCSINSIPISSKVTDISDSRIDSSMGEVNFQIKCNGSQDYRVLWLLDKYDNSSRNWFTYDSSNHNELKRIEFKTIVFDLSNDYTTGIIMDFDNPKAVSFLQSYSFESPTLDRQEASVIADIENSNTNILVVAVLMLLGSGAIWLIYKRFFAYPDPSRTNYPRIDHF